MTRLFLTTWALERLPQSERPDLERRAESLDVGVTAIYGSRHRRWTVRVLRGDEVIATVRAHGSLAAAMHGALDDVEALAFTPDELMMIAAQSGIEVYRG